MDSAYKLLLKYTINLLRPDRPASWRAIRTSNAAFKARVDCMLQAREILKQIGYSEETRDSVCFPVDVGEPDVEMLRKLAAELLMAKYEVEWILQQGETAGGHPTSPQEPIFEPAPPTSSDPTPSYFSPPSPRTHEQGETAHGYPTLPQETAYNPSPPTSSVHTPSHPSHPSHPSPHPAPIHSHGAWEDSVSSQVPRTHEQGETAGNHPTLLQETVFKPASLALSDSTPLYLSSASSHPAPSHSPEARAEPPSPRVPRPRKRLKSEDGHPTLPQEPAPLTHYAVPSHPSQPTPPPQPREAWVEPASSRPSHTQREEEKEEEEKKAERYYSASSRHMAALPTAQERPQNWSTEQHAYSEQPSGGSQEHV